MAEVEAEVAEILTLEMTMERIKNSYIRGKANNVEPISDQKLEKPNSGDAAK